MTGAIRLQAVEGAALAGYPGYVAGLADDDFTTVESQFTDKVQTDDKGHADLSVDLPEGSSTRPLEAKLIVDVAEPGGRTVERTVTLPVRAKSVTIGVKKNFDATLSAGDVATFEAIAVAPDGARVARKGAEWSIYQVMQRLSMVQRRRPLELRAGEVVEAHRQRDDRHRRRRAGQILERRRLGRASARHQDARRRGDERHLRRRLVGHGERRYARQCRRDARQDELRARRGGEAAHRLGLRRQGDGRARRRQVERFIDVDLVAGDNVVPFPVGADWGPGAYAVALTHRPLDVSARRMPGRAIGVAWFAIDRDAHKLDIALDAPQLARPRQSMTVPIKVAGLAPGEEAFVTVSAVDVGILNLTGFKTPDPGGYFFGQRKLPVEVRDLWGMLIDGMQGAAGAIHAGGDTAAASKAICRRRSRSRSSPASSSSTATAKPTCRSICRRSMDRCG